MHYDFIDYTTPGEVWTFPLCGCGLPTQNPNWRTQSWAYNSIHGFVDLGSTHSVDKIMHRERDEQWEQQ